MAYVLRGRQRLMTADAVLQTLLTVAVIVITTMNVSLWAFRPGSYRTSPRARGAMGAITIVWVIVLPVGGAIALGLGADAVATSQTSAWQGIVIGGIAIACWPGAIMALRKIRARPHS